MRTCFYVAFIRPVPVYLGKASARGRLRRRLLRRGLGERRRRARR
jgi:hypothetical protein